MPSSFYCAQPAAAAAAAEHANILSAGILLVAASAGIVLRSSLGIALAAARAGIALVVASSGLLWGRQASADLPPAAARSA